MRNTIRLSPRLLAVRILAASLATSVWFAAVTQGQIPLNDKPTRVVGQRQLQVTSASPNLVEAKDLYSPYGIAIDSSASPPILYVSDYLNNRVLGWKNLTGFSNGDPADLVIGQRDFYSTLPNGPGTDLSVGFAFPTSLAVDGSGNLYVADTGNNRILRYPKPFSQQNDLQPDMVIGQPDYRSRNPNNGAVDAAPTEKSLRLFTGTLYSTGMVFAPNGDLWFSDGGNNRVLRYPASALSAGTNQPAADAVLGQISFTANTPATSPLSKGTLVAPRGLALDQSGRLYVCDAGRRVLVFTQPRNGSQADRIMGLVVQLAGQPAPPEVTETTLGRTGGAPPESLVIINGNPFVLDSGAHRIVRFDSYELWPPESTSLSPPGRAFIGQADAFTAKVNRGTPEPSNNSFNFPVAAAVYQDRVGGTVNVFVVDSGNNRVLDFPLQGGTLTAAARVLGQGDFYQSAPNFIDGREFNLWGFGDGGAVVVDNQSNPPRMYVSDTYNHRILAFGDVRKVRPGDRADLVIGQRDFTRALVNSPTNDPNQLTDSGLFVPTGLALDAAGNLFVADSGNGRVLRFPRPFDQQDAQIRPDLVLGQANFFQKITDATPRTMFRPQGIAFSADGHLVVSDSGHNRVLFFRKPAGGDFASGQAAEKVFGQPDFTSIARGDTLNRMTSPHGVAMDTDDRLYVADTGNNRILVYDTIIFADLDAFPAFSLTGVTTPYSVYVSPITGEIWASDTGTGYARRFPRYLELALFGDTRSNAAIPMALNARNQLQVAVSVTQDAFGALYVTDGANRVAVYYPGLNVVNGANQFRRLAPGGYSKLRPVVNANFGDTTLSAKDVPGTPPLPGVLGDLQLLVNDVPAPLESVSPTEISFYVPSGTPTSQSVSVVLVRNSTGQTLGASQISASPLAPGFLTVSGTGNGQVVAKNASGVANSPNDRAKWGEVISLFMTGLGVVPGGPPDGTPAADKVPIRVSLQLSMGASFVPAENIVYVGLAPGMVGIYQVDVKIPSNVAPDPSVPVACLVNSISCNTEAGVGTVRTTIGVIN